jgi:hypothetical protein
MKIFTLLFFLLLFNNAFSQYLNVPQVIQEQDQWCWAGVSACVLGYYGTTIPQCTIAEYTRVSATWHNFGTVNCCNDASQGCNYWNYNWGAAGSIEDILLHWGVSSYGTGAFSVSTIKSELNAGRPFIFRWGWTTGGGHFLVGHGFSASDSMLSYMNPWFGEGLKIAKYSWVMSSSDHSWTHTNQITTNPTPVELIAFSAYQSSSSIILNWTTATEHNNFGYEVERSNDNWNWVKISYVPGSGTTNTQNSYQIRDKNIEQPGKYYYRLKQIDNNGSYKYYKSVEVLFSGPDLITLNQNYPNPFNPSTEISFYLPQENNIKLQIYSVTGELIRTLIDGNIKSGYHSFDFSADNLSSGIYFYKLITDHNILSKKMILLR